MSNEKKRTRYEAMTELAEKMRLANGDHFELKEDALAGMPGCETTAQGALVMMSIVEAAQRAEIGGVMAPAMIAVMNQTAKAVRAVSVVVFEEFNKQVQACPPELMAQFPAMQAFVVSSIIGTLETQWRAMGPAVNSPESLVILRIFAEAGENLGVAVAEGINEEVLKERTMAIVQEALSKAKAGAAPTLTDDEVRQILRRPKGSA